MLEFDPMLFLVIAFAAYLAALLAVVYTSKKSSESVVYLPQSISPTPALQTPVAKPKLYKYTITAPNLIKAQGIIKQLEQNNINYTLKKSLSENTTIQFVTDKQLLNIDELKKKGINIQVEEAKGEAEHSNPKGEDEDCSSFTYSPT